MVKDYPKEPQYSVSIPVEIVYRAEWQNSKEDQEIVRKVFEANGLHVGLQMITVDQLRQAVRSINSLTVAFEQSTVALRELELTFNDFGYDHNHIKETPKERLHRERAEKQINAKRNPGWKR